ncbi:zinc-ribbon domain-containing protein [Patescibacteria group bacterium]|jgi:uncharacterized membrane protein YvbJ|uniref:Zinc-ribbon domain-containing protein n=1 Tax=candidate division WWE3 bacterium TaxID=2053526 RepID=A0A928Y6W2_UNCKA|nr:zinc-ribbon domain-containing protein [candidate division WWE3 bacterium]MCL4732645.1 zinc-ribbon domain-containing protein [Patescibacteria group bacterium]MDL1952701.1 zinc-ribbon domain-containing protein [Candidatus Uhrbacteria bacterium UHB]RIL01169.1 MAG: hypothetical protein DCC77_01360 [Candidatus Uhrbacteria bacterium]
MTLINCSECGREVSDKATACPNCGNPIGAQHIKQPTLIEQTSKTWKFTQLLGWILMLFGVFIFFPSFNMRGLRDPMAGLGILVFSLGILTALVGKFEAWWHHS